MDKLNAVIPVITQALADGTVYNPEVSEFKDAVVYNLKRAYDKARDDELYNPARAMTDDAARRKWFDERDPDAMFGVQSLKKLLAHHTKMAAQMPKMLKIVQGLAEYKEIMDRLKPTIVKGKRPAPIDPAKARKIADYSVQKQVIQYLNEAAAGVRKQLFDATHKMIQGDIALMKKANISDRKGYWEFLKKRPDLQLLAQSVFNVEKDRFNSNPSYTFVPDAEVANIAFRDATRMTDDIIAQFVAKNTQKLSMIVQRKQAIKSHKILTNRVRNNVLENEMFFEFNDNSSFKIYSKVEYAYSPKGKLFMRMPTRFTDVTMPDGSRMKGAASEERMTTEF